MQESDLIKVRDEEEFDEPIMEEDNGAKQAIPLSLITHLEKTPSKHLPETISVYRPVQSNVTMQYMK